MRLCEITFTISKNGVLKLPAALLVKMGLSPGDHIRVAYLTDDGTNNIFKEFLLCSEAVTAYGEEQRIAIPSSLLQQANIPLDADIQIVCLDGMLMIGAETKLDLGELAAVLEGLTVSVDITEKLHSDAEKIQSQLIETIDNLRGEFES